MDITLKPACHLSFDRLAALFNDAFAGYVGGDVHFTAESLASFIARDGVDLSLSQVFMHEDQPVGFGYIQRQGGESRLAAFGIIPSTSHQGVGRASMLRLIEQAKARGDRALELEVIEQNPRAVKLYQGVGFEIVRRLVGYTGKSPQGSVGAVRNFVSPASPDVEAEPMDLDLAARLVVRYGERNLPWQINGSTMLKLSPPTIGYHLGAATAIISDPAAETISFRSLIVDPVSRRQGQAARLLSALFAQFPGKTWVVHPIFPEEYVKPLAEKFGFKLQPISQWQMRLKL